MAIVPATWLTQDQKSCLWPPVRILNAADSMAQKKCLPDGTILLEFCFPQVWTKQF
jgi:hypothetical protein